MNQKQTENYNRLCAQFLGGKYSSKYEYWDFLPVKWYRNFYLKTEDLEFHSDWNWIMEVVEAIEKLNDNFYFVKINTGGCFIHPLNDTKDYKGICYQAGKTKQEAVVQAINQFLIWYEQNKTK